MKKQIIRLTESDLHKIIKESVIKILEDNTFDNHIADNIFDDMIKRGLYRRLQPEQLKDYIMREYGLRIGQESIADDVSSRLISYKQEMEGEYGITENKRRVVKEGVPDPSDVLDDDIYYNNYFDDDGLEYDYEGNIIPGQDEPDDFDEKYYGL